MIVFVIVSCDKNVDKSGNIIQISKAVKGSDVRMLKAILLPCESHLQHDKAKCKSRLNIKAWFDPKNEHEMFLLIDEVYDTKERMKYSLMEPYLIQVSTSEQTLSYPLLLNQVVNVSCNERNELVQRREAGNDRTLAAEGSELLQ